MKAPKIKRNLKPSAHFKAKAGDPGEELVHGRSSKRGEEGKAGGIRAGQ